MNMRAFPASPIREMVITASIEVIENFIDVIEQCISEAEIFESEEKQQLVDDGAFHLNKAYKEYFKLLKIGADGVRPMGELHQLGSRLGDLAQLLNGMCARRI